MCGIVGYIGNRKASELLLSGIKRLEYRGYDSIGMATIYDDRFFCKKGVGKVDEVNQNVKFTELPGTAGMVHCRWATHGGVTEANAHPHFDCKNNIAVVHNGIISNYLELKRNLQARGHIFRSETDTEVFAHLVEENYNGNLENAVMTALKSVKGTYAFLVASKNENKLVCARKESPVVLGIGENGTFVSSDISSFLEFTNRAIPLDDGEVCVVGNNSHKILDSKTGAEKLKNEMLIDWKPESIDKSGYDHFMLKEICEQPTTIRIAKGIHSEEVKRLARMIDDHDTVYLIATGSSMHAAMIAEYWFAEIAHKRVQAIDSSEFSQKGIINGSTLAIAITQSGETYDTLTAARFAKKNGARLASIVNVANSTATRESGITIMQGSGFESAVCSTKTFTSQLIIILRLAIEVAKLKGKDVSMLENEVEKLPSVVKEIIDNKEKIKKIAEENFSVKNYLYIGRGLNVVTALEGALKLKEISYLHAEGMSAGFLKHGTISLIDDNMYTVAFIPKDDRKVLSNIEEIKARGGKIIAIAAGGTTHVNTVIDVPAVDDLVSPIPFTVASQLIAYYVAKKLGNDIDRPRALAKSVTVE
ncbi:MAG: glutamine--fructose-6-phosphate transaminase (isomerizing) [Candidatus Aenigmarchaeota archaeon]|nr:glutamine--fructose-6-phosphate transaminase (isomerizing) [Candidatus Aenigmarchaeota archaeon]